MTCTLTINTDYGFQYKVQTEVGQRLLDICNDSAHTLNAPCGGRGKCGKCQVKASGRLSAISEKERMLLSEGEIRNGVRLACLCHIEGDAEIWLSEERTCILLDGISNVQVSLRPAFTAEYVCVSKPSLTDQRSDLERLNEVCGSSSATIQALRALPLAARKQDGHFWVVKDCCNNRITAVTVEEPALFGAAIDIGTTTIAAYLIDLKTGNTIESCSALNPQRAHGADVISRIDYARQQNGLVVLQKSITEKIVELIRQMMVHAKVDEQDLRQIQCVGNTVMIHLLLGISPEHIASSPFVPVFVQGLTISAEELDMPFENVVVGTCACVAGYIGADTTAAILACGMDRSKKISLLIDIGTNGEIALGNSDGIVCCSAAAGPAFEGAHIRCGSGAVEGAISGVTLTESGEVLLKTIGDSYPVSICGSGLIDVIAEMLRIGLIDETGRIDEEQAPEIWKDRLFHSLSGLAFALTEDKEVFVCQKDIREVQLAKGAIAAGIRILLKQLEVRFSEVKQLYLAGGFGNYIDVHNACMIGLLPAELEQCAIPVGNAAGTGARHMLLDSTACSKVENLAKSMRYIELSSERDFPDLFSENMLF